jgi:hypothetical protein
MNNSSSFVVIHPAQVEIELPCKVFPSREKSQPPYPIVLDQDKTDAVSHETYT